MPTASKPEGELDLWTARCRARARGQGRRINPSGLDPALAAHIEGDRTIDAERTTQRAGTAAPSRLSPPYVQHSPPGVRHSPPGVRQSLLAYCPVQG